MTKPTAVAFSVMVRPIRRIGRIEMAKVSGVVVSQA